MQEVGLSTVAGGGGFRKKGFLGGGEGWGGERERGGGKGKDAYGK